MSVATTDYVADWRTYRENMKARRGVRNNTYVGPNPSSNTSTTNTSTTNNTTTTTNTSSTVLSNNGESEQWHRKYIALEKKTQHFITQQQQTVREQVQRELALARQKSAVLGEQVEALEISAAELDERTQQRDELSSKLRVAMKKLEELETMNIDLREANDRLTKGLEVAMKTANKDRHSAQRLRDHEHDLIHESKLKVAASEKLVQQGKQKLCECTDSLKEETRLRIQLEKEMKAMKEQLVLERHVASDKIQELASKLQVALTNRDENTQTYQLALAESQEKQKALELEIAVLKNIPSDLLKLKKKLKKNKKKLLAYERQVKYDTENLIRETSNGLRSITAGTGIHTGNKIERSRNIRSNGDKNDKILTLQSIAGRELMIAHQINEAIGGGNTGTM